MLAVFTQEQHVRHAFLSVLMLHVVLKARCDSFNIEHPSFTKTGVGIGMESGDISKIIPARRRGATPQIVASIGTCINIAARIEGLTKVFAFARTIIGEKSNELLCRLLYQRSYNGLARRATVRSLSDEARLRLHDSMTELNRFLCISWIHQHNLKGVNSPIALFRVSGETAFPGNVRFNNLLGQLTANKSHRDELLANLARAKTSVRPEA